MTQATQINKLEAINVAANFIYLNWENIGGVFSYKLERSLSASPLAWTVLTTTTDSAYWDTGLLPLTSYIYRITTVATGYDDSTPYLSSVITTFETNSYTISTKDSVHLYSDFIENYFTSPGDGSPVYIDFNNDDIETVPMRYGYEFNKLHTSINDSAVQEHILTTAERLKLYGNPTTTCNGIASPMVFFAKETIFIFDRLQRIIKISTDFGQTWWADQSLYRVGAPVGQQCCVYDADTEALIILGYDCIFRFDISQPLTKDTDIDNLMVKLANLPPGVSAGGMDCIGASDDNVYVSSNNYLYYFNKAADGSPIASWNYAQSPVGSSLIINANTSIKVKNMVWLETVDELRFYIPNEWDNTKKQFSYNIDYTNYGVWVLTDLGSPTNIQRATDTYDITSFLDPNTITLSRNNTSFIISLVNTPLYNQLIDFNFWPISLSGSPEELTYQLSAFGYGDKERPAGASFQPQSPGVFVDSVYQYESQYIWCGDGNRVRLTDDHKIGIIHKAKTYEQLLTNVSSEFDDGQTIIYADPYSWETLEGYVIGSIFYKKTTGTLIGFNTLPVKSTAPVNFSWASGVVAKGILRTVSTDVTEALEVKTEPRDIIPRLDPLVAKYVPQWYVDEEPTFVKFIEYYMKFISQDTLSNYGILYNLVKQHDVNETDFLELFETDLSRRNVIGTQEKKDELIKFIHNHKHDIFSIKGTEDSYKFMFKLLYNVDAEVKVESDYKIVHKVDVGIKSIDSIPAYSLTQEELDEYIVSWVGSRINSIENSIGAADIIAVKFKGTQEDDEVPEGYEIPVYTITIANIYGVFAESEDYKIKSDNTIIKTLTALSEFDLNLSDESYLDDDINFGFPLRIEVQLPVSQYKTDLLQFVHPVGFPFFGVYLIASFVNSGITFDHLETIVDFYSTVHWDSGIPSVYPSTIPDLSLSSPVGEYTFGGSPYDLIEIAEPNGLAGQSFPQPGYVGSPQVIGSPTRPEYIMYGSGGSQYAIDEPDSSPLTYGQTQLQRRKPNSPLFSSSWGRFFDRIYIPSLRLKDNDGNSPVSQSKVE